MHNRYFDNRLDASAAAPSRQTILASLNESLRFALSKIGSRSSIYTGSAGIAYACWHVLRHREAVASVLPTSEVLRAAEEVARKALDAVAARPREDAGWSLLAGHAGVYVAAALCLEASATAAQAGGRSERSGALRREVEACLEAYRGLADLAISPACEEDECLYGRAGYLAGASLLNVALRPEAVPSELMQKVAAKMIASGRASAAALPNPAACPTPLFYVWPPGPDADPYLGRWRAGMTAAEASPLYFHWHGKPYLGAAHGMIGILHVLLGCRQQLEAIPGGRRDVEGALAYVLALECDAAGRRGAHGHYPTQMGPARDREPLVHWCHGAPGALLLLCRAHDVLGGPDYLPAALRAGEAVWQRGLLRKGPGACHGISGNAYALLRLWRATGDDLWLRRAQQFAAFMNSDEFRTGARTPDHPHSLFEGWAAAACLWADLLAPERAAFPLFEVAG